MRNLPSAMRLNFAAVQGTYDRIRDYLRDRNLLGLFDLEVAVGRLSVKKDRKALS